MNVCFIAIRKALRFRDDAGKTAGTIEQASTL
jgi:hypothetical protein